MLLRHGWSMLTVPLSPSMARMCREQYRQERTRWGRSRVQAHEAITELAFYSVVADHPDFDRRPRADAPDFLRGAA